MLQGLEKPRKLVPDHTKHTINPYGSYDIGCLSLYKKDSRSGQKERKNLIWNAHADKRVKHALRSMQFRITFIIKINVSNPHQLSQKNIFYRTDR